MNQSTLIYFEILMFTADVCVISQSYCQSN